MLPGLNGIEVIKRLRQAVPIPVVMLTARGSEEDRVAGLELGADDYLAKPFSPRELAARVKAVLRRAAGGVRTSVGAVMASGGLTVDLVAHEAVLDGKVLALTAKEFDLLAHFIANPGRAFRREELLQAVWGYSVGDTANDHSARPKAAREDRSRSLEPAAPVHGARPRLPVGAMKTFVRAAVLIVGGALVAGLLALASGTSVGDAAVVVALAAGGALAAAVAGAALLRTLRTRSLRVQVLAVAVATMVTMVAGVLLAAEFMLVSDHDLAVLAVVLVVAGSVAGGAALYLGDMYERDTREVGDLAERLVDPNAGAHDDG